MNQIQKTMYWRTSRRFQNVKYIRLNNDFHVVFAAKSLMEYGFNVTDLNDSSPLFTNFISHSETDYFATEVFSRFNSGESRIQLEFSIHPDPKTASKRIYCVIYRNRQSKADELSYDCFLLDKEAQSFCSDLADACEMAADMAYKRAFDNLDLPVTISSDMNFQYVNKAFSEMVDYNLNQLHCMRLNSIIGDSSYSTVISRENKHYNGYSTEKNTVELKTKSDATIFTNLIGTPLSVNNYSTSLNFYIDVTDAIHKSKDFTEMLTVINHMNEAILITDINQSEFWTNIAFTECTGLHSDEIVDFTRNLKFPDGTPVNLAQSVIPVMNEDGIWQGILEVERKDKSTFTAQGTLIKTGNHKEHRFALILKDLSLEIMRERQLAARESSDKLTGINSRESFLKNLEIACEKAKEIDDTIHLLVFEIDNFRTINDQVGFAIGDSMLRTISMRMAAVVGDKTRIARFGGVSFALYFYASEQDKFISSFIEYIKLPFVFENYDGEVTVSVGIASHNKTDSIDELCKKAFKAMEDAAKTQGRSSCTLYHNGELRPFVEKEFISNKQ